MSKDCKECEYNKGFDWETGEPQCEPAGGHCPYNGVAEAKKMKEENGFKIEIDGTFLTEYIQHILSNTVAGKTQEIAELEVKRIVNATAKEEIEKIAKMAMAAIVDEQISEFMSGEITIGGGWREPERTINRAEYLSELIEKELSKRFADDVLKKYAIRTAEEQIGRFSRKLHDEVNQSVKELFDAATRSTLTDNIVSMLMNNDTYKRLSESMKTFLPQSQQ